MLRDGNFGNCWRSIVRTPASPLKPSPIAELVSGTAPPAGAPSAFGTLRLWLAAAALFTVLALLNSVEAYTANLSSGYRLPWGRALLWGAITWYLWLPAMPLSLQLNAWLHRTYVGWKVRALLSALSIVLVAGAHSLLIGVFYYAAIGHLSEFPWFLKHKPFVLMTDFLVGSVVCVAVFCAFQALSYYRRFEQGRAEAARLESELAQAQLRALKMQVQPHFLFNTLHSISALLLVDVETAQRVTTRLGDFLRMTLRSPSDQEITLAQELEFLNCYLDIERVRFKDRLSVNLDIHPSVLGARVPNLLLQPIVENAIRHGISARIGPGRLLAIRCHRHDAELRLVVADNGPGIPDLEKHSVTEGIGLQNTRERLLHLYGAGQRLQLRNVPGGGLEVEITIPFELAAPERRDLAHA